MPDVLTKNPKVLCIKTKQPIKDVKIIKELHPKIEYVHLPRQKNARFCLVKFETPEECSQVKKELKNKTLNSKRIYVSFGQLREPKKAEQRFIILVKNVPKHIKRRDLKKAVPAATKIKLKRPTQKNKKSYALLVFDNKLASHIVIAQNKLTIKDTTLELKNISRKIKPKPNSTKISTPRYFELGQKNLKLAKKSKMKKDEEEADEGRGSNEEDQEDSDSDISISSSDFSSGVEDFHQNFEIDSDE